METPQLEELLLVSLRRITRAISLRSQVLQKEIGLTSPQLAALHTIKRLQPVATGKIADELHLGQPTVTGIITRLEQGGFITRTRGASDRRSVAIALTDKGAESLATAPSLLECKFRQELSDLPQWEQGQILSTLQRVADMMHATEVHPLTEQEVAEARQSSSKTLPK